MFRRILAVALLPLSVVAAPLQATTVLTVDLQFDSGNRDSSSATLLTDSSGHLRAYGGFPQFASAQHLHSMALLNFGITALNGLAYDNIYLSLTEIRSTALLAGEVSVYSNDGTFPDEVLDSIAVDAATQLAFDSKQSLVGSLDGIGVGGNHLLLDVTSAVDTALAASEDIIGFLLRDDIDDGVGFAALGRNYNSGSPVQYYASSLYEYPTLIATTGAGITPFSDLPPRPITDDPLEPPPTPSPPPIPEPSTLAIWVGLAIATGFIAQRKTRATLKPRGQGQ